MDYNLSSSHEISNVIYLIILIVILLSGLTNRHISGKKIIKYVVIWSLFAVILLGFYSYRYEFFEIKQRILSDLFPSKAINKDNKKLVISISDDNHYYLTLKINNQFIKFMIDTGASEVVIDKKLAIKLGIRIDNLFYDKIFRTANGNVAGASIYFDEIDISGIKFYNVPASITNSILPNPLLGMSFLKRFQKYEFFRDKLILSI